MRQNVVARIEEIAQKVASSDGLEVVEVELKGSGRNQMLRIYIDKPQGVTHADCELVSLGVGNILETENLFPGNYTLEAEDRTQISSPRSLAQGLGCKDVKTLNLWLLTVHRANEPSLWV